MPGNLESFTYKSNILNVFAERETDRHRQTDRQADRGRERALTLRKADLWVPIKFFQHDKYMRYVHIHVLKMRGVSISSL